MDAALRTPEQPAGACSSAIATPARAPSQAAGPLSSPLDLVPATSNDGGAVSGVAKASDADKALQTLMSFLPDELLCEGGGGVGESGSGVCEESEKSGEENGERRESVAMLVGNLSSKDWKERVRCVDGLCKGMVSGLDRWIGGEEKKESVGEVRGVCDAFVEIVVGRVGRKEKHIAVVPAVLRGVGEVCRKAYEIGVEKTKGESVVSEEAGKAVVEVCVEKIGESKFEEAACECVTGVSVLLTPKVVCDWVFRHAAGQKNAKIAPGVLGWFRKSVVEGFGVQSVDLRGLQEFLKPLFGSRSGEVRSQALVCAGMMLRTRKEEYEEVLRESGVSEDTVGQIEKKAGEVDGSVGSVQRLFTIGERARGMGPCGGSSEMSGSWSGGGSRVGASKSVGGSGVRGGVDVGGALSGGSESSGGLSGRSGREKEGVQSGKMTRFSLPSEADVAAVSSLSGPGSNSSLYARGGTPMAPKARFTESFPSSSSSSSSSSFTSTTTISSSSSSSSSLQSSSSSSLPLSSPAVEMSPWDGGSYMSPGRPLVMGRVSKGVSSSGSLSSPLSSPPSTTPLHAPSRSHGVGTVLGDLGSPSSVGYVSEVGEGGMGERRVFGGVEGSPYVPGFGGAIQSSEGAGGSGGDEEDDVSERMECESEPSTKPVESMNQLFHTDFERLGLRADVSQLVGFLGQRLRSPNLEERKTALDTVVFILRSTKKQCSGRSLSEFVSNELLPILRDLSKEVAGKGVVICKEIAMNCGRTAFIHAQSIVPMLCVLLDSEDEQFRCTVTLALDEWSNGIGFRQMIRFLPYPLSLRTPVASGECLVWLMNQLLMFVDSSAQKSSETTAVQSSSSPSSSSGGTSASGADSVSGEGERAVQHHISCLTEAQLAGFKKQLLKCLCSIVGRWGRSSERFQHNASIVFIEMIRVCGWESVEATVQKEQPQEEFASLRHALETARIAAQTAQPLIAFVFNAVPVLSPRRSGDAVTSFPPSTSPLPSSSSVPSSVSPTSTLFSHQGTTRFATSTRSTSSTVSSSSRLPTSSESVSSIQSIPSSSTTTTTTTTSSSSSSFPVASSATHPKTSPTSFSAISSHTPTFTPLAAHHVSAQPDFDRTWTPAEWVSRCGSLFSGSNAQQLVGPSALPPETLVLDIDYGLAIEFHKKFGLLSQTNGIDAVIPVFGEMTPVLINHFRTCMTFLYVKAPSFAAQPQMGLTICRLLRYSLNSLLVIYNTPLRTKHIPLAISFSVFDILFTSLVDPSLASAPTPLNCIWSLLNTLVLHVLENTDRTNALRVLVAMLGQSALPGSPLVTDERALKKTRFVERSLVKLAKVIPTSISEIRVDEIVPDLDLFLSGSQACILQASAQSAHINALSGLGETSTFVLDPGAKWRLKMVKTLFVAFIQLSPDRGLNVLHALCSCTKQPPFSLSLVRRIIFEIYGAESLQRADVEVQGPCGWGAEVLARCHSESRVKEQAIRMGISSSDGDPAYFSASDVLGLGSDSLVGEPYRV